MTGATGSHILLQTWPAASCQIAQQYRKSHAQNVSVVNWSAHYVGLVVNARDPFSTLTQLPMPLNAATCVHHGVTHKLFVIGLHSI